MKDILRKYYYLILGALRGRTFRPLAFELAQIKSLSSHSSDFLVVYLKHQAHLLEKCTKNSFDGRVRGQDKYQLVLALIAELKRRNCKETEILDWSLHISKKYDLWCSEKEIQVDEYQPVCERASVYDIESVRFFGDDIPPRALLLECLEAAQKASASCNRQAFRIGIIENKSPFFGEANNVSLFSKAPYRVFLFSNRSNYSEKYADAIDVGMFSQNFMLKANELGLGVCCCYASEHIDISQSHYRSLFKLPDSYYCYLSMVVGYPAESAKKPPRRKVEEITTFIDLNR